MATSKYTNHGNKTHGMSRTRIYWVWRSMLQRCFNPKHVSYGRYGGVGISVCERWRDFGNFFSDVGNPPENGLTLDRIDSSLGYSPSNFRWASYREQARNTKRNVLLTAFGKTQCLTAWAEETKIHKDTIGKRLKAGWPMEAALTERPSFVSNRHSKRAKASKQP